LVVPPNTFHTIIQHGRKPLKLYTIYTPPNHARKRVDRTQPEDDWKYLSCGRQKRIINTRRLFVCQAHIVTRSDFTHPYIYF
jgi:oxalate decarboxylase/phosphoglucose isomerase-like protein (cupin superfamily)